MIFVTNSSALTLWALSLVMQTLFKQNTSFLYVVVTTRFVKFASHVLLRQAQHHSMGVANWRMSESTVMAPSPTGRCLLFDTPVVNINLFHRCHSKSSIIYENLAIISDYVCIHKVIRTIWSWYPTPLKVDHSSAVNVEWSHADINFRCGHFQRHIYLTHIRTSNRERRSYFMNI